MILLVGLHEYLYHVITSITIPPQQSPRYASRCSGKCNVTVWRPSVCRSVCLSRQLTHRDSPRGRIQRDHRIYFGPTIRTRLYQRHHKPSL